MDDSRMGNVRGLSDSMLKSRVATRVVRQGYPRLGTNSESLPLGSEVSHRSESLSTPRVSRRSNPIAHTAHGKPQRFFSLCAHRGSVNETLTVLALVVIV